MASLAQALQAQILAIAAAADLVYCLDELHTEFQKAYPRATLKVSTGSSGNFFAQIKNGAPFDVLLSADMKYPQELIKAGLADSASLTLYAIGRIVLWTIKPEIEVSRGLEILREAKIRKFAIASPEHAPYGRAAKAALEARQLWSAVQKNRFWRKHRANRTICPNRQRRCWHCGAIFSDLTQVVEYRQIL
jgi:molybdate transport system substrate-binding protein